MDLEQFRYYTAWHQHANQRSYEAPASPWRLLSVSPAVVDWYHPNLQLNWDSVGWKVESGTTRATAHTSETPLFIKGSESAVLNRC